MIIALLCAVIVGLLWSMTLERMHYERTQTIAEAVGNNDNLALAFDENTILSLKNIDRALLLLIHGYARDGLQFDIRNLVKSGLIDDSSFNFIGGFVEWLAHSSHLPVRFSMHGELMLPGHVYVAPDECQMKVERGGKIVLTDDPPENGLRPSVSCLFRSIAEIYGSDAVAGLLTGMGRDGAEELRLLKERGAATFAQDKDSSVVHGMPGEAIRLDAVMFILPPEKIAAVLTNLANNRGNKGRN